MTSGGRFDFDDGGTYCGSWEDGKALGYGVCTGPKGQGAYYGAYHNGFEISGVYKWTTGSAYKGQWTQGKRHGLGVESKGRWVYQGEWTQGFKGRYGARQSSSTGAKYEGTWTTGLQDGYGVETYADGGTYSGQWLRGIRHGYGVRRSVPYGLATLSRQKAGRESLTSLRSENEEDQIVKDRDRRMEEIRGGFVLSSKRAMSEVRSASRRADSSNQRRSNSAEPTKSGAKATLRRAFEGLRLRKQRSEELDNDANLTNSPSSTEDRRRFTSGSGSARSWLRRKNEIDDANKSNTSSSYASSMRYSPVSAVTSESCASFLQDDSADPSDIESYSGEWKNDKRSGFGVAERTDGLKYEGEWDNNKRHGYGSTTFPDGLKEEGKYKNDLLVSAGRKSKFLLLRGNKMKEHVENAIAAAQRASQIAAQKAEIAINRMGTARAKAELAMQAADKAQSDAEKARLKAMEYAPDFMAELEKKCAAIPILGISHFQSKGGTQHHLHEASHSSPLDAAVSFVSQFTDHYNPQNQFQNAKSFLTRVKATTDPATGIDESKLPLPSIGNALLSAGLESGLLKSLAQKPMQPFQSTTRHAPTSHNISNGGSTNQFEAKKMTTNSSTPSNMSSERSHKEDTRKRLHDIEISMAVPMTQKLPSNLKMVREGSNQKADSKFSQATNQSVLDDHFDQYQTKEEETKVTPSAKSPPPQTSTSSPQVIQPKLTEPTGSPWELYHHQQQMQLQLQQQQQFFEQQQQVLLQEQQHYNANRFSSDIPFSYDNPRGISGQNPGFYDQVDQGSRQHHGQVFVPTPSSYERRQTLPPGQLEEVIKTSLFQEPKVPSRQKEAPVIMRPSSTSKPIREAMGSMPDVSRRKNKAHEEPAMPREEVHVMSMRRREEIRKLREEEERRRQQELVLSFGEFRNWCHQRQLLVFLIAINLGLAAVFFNLLTR